MFVMVSHRFHSALEFIVNFPGHFEENLDTGTKLLFPGQSRETRDGWQVCYDFIFHSLLSYGCSYLSMKRSQVATTITKQAVGSHATECSEVRKRAIRRFSELSVF